MCAEKAPPGIGRNPTWEGGFRPIPALAPGPDRDRRRTIGDLRRIARNPRRQTMGDLFAPSHLIVIMIIVLFIFGPGKLPGIGKDLGKSIREFKKAISEPEAPAPTAQPVARQAEPAPTLEEIRAAAATKTPASPLDLG
jgi:sec-independent protein translocase protein TatA